MKKPRVVLVQAQTASEDSGLREERWYLPLGLLSIATVLRNNGFEDVVVLDLQHDDLTDVSRALEQQPAILGVNFNVFSIELFHQVLDIGREADALKIVGGPAATPIPFRLLEGNPAIDLVVAYDGEWPMLEIVQRFSQGLNDFRDVRNVLCHTSNDRKFRFSTSPGSRLPAGVIAPPVADYPTVDRTLVNSERYLDAWNDELIDPYRRPTSAYFQKGCGKTCTFCARIDKRLRQRTADQFVDELREVHEIGGNFIYIVDDTFAADASYLRSLAESERPEDIRFWCFADIRDLDQERVRLLKALQVEKVLIGIESGNEELRRRNGKIFSNRMLFRRLESVARAGIKVEDSYVLGMAGETDRTLRDTRNLAKRVASISHTEGTAFNIMTPLLGSPDWNRMMQVPSLQAKYGVGYNFCVDEVREDYFRHFCRFDLEALEIKGSNAVVG